MSNSDEYSRDTRVIRPGGSGPAAATRPAPASAEPASATPANAAPSTPAAASGAGGIVAELKPYFPRMALGAALVILAELWWSGRTRRRERRREKRWRERRRRR